MPFDSMLVVGFVCLMFVVFAVGVVWAQIQTEKADASRPPVAAGQETARPADNDNRHSHAA